MREHTPSPLTVAETAVGVAMARAKETRRRDALFHDPYAATLAGPRGNAVARRMGSPDWAVTVRTRVFDDLLLSTIRSDGVCAVLNLGAGLDARPYRLDLPAELRWIEVDAPETVAAKEHILAAATPRCRLERYAGDLADDAAGERLLDLAAPGPALLLTEGVLHYLAPDAVAALSAAALARPALRWWLLDVADPLTVTWGRRSTSAVNLWRFTPANGIEQFKAWGWRPAAVLSGWEEARRLGRQTWLMRLAWAVSSGQRQRFRGLTTYALLERGAN